MNGANLKFRDCFDNIAIALGKPKATIKATPILKEIAWRVDAVRAFITAKKPLLTKETANSAMKSNTYSAKKIEALLGYQFTDMNTTIKKYANWFIADLK